MTAIIIGIHVIACVGLIVIVLVQRGRGGGLVEMASGLESMFGVKTSAFLTRATSVLAVVFLCTCLILTFLAIRRSRSLMKNNVPAVVQEEAAVLPQSQEEPVSPVSVDQTAVPQPVSGQQPSVAQPLVPKKDLGFKKETSAAPIVQEEPVRGLIPVQDVSIKENDESANEVAPHDLQKDETPDLDEKK